MDKISLSRPQTHLEHIVVKQHLIVRMMHEFMQVLTFHANDYRGTAKRVQNIQHRNIIRISAHDHGGVIGIHKAFCDQMRISAPFSTM